MFSATLSCLSYREHNQIIITIVTLFLVVGCVPGAVVITSLHAFSHWKPTIALIGR